MSDFFGVRRDGPWSAVEPFKAHGPLFDDMEIVEALRIPTEEHLFQSLTMRGFFDE